MGCGIEGGQFNADSPDIKKVGRFVQYVENHEGDGDDT